MKNSLRILFFLAITAITSLAQESSTSPGTQVVRGVPDINGRATLLVKPSLPGDVMIEQDGATLALRIVVDTDGNVLSAKCSTACHADVAAAAETAAMASKFRPLVVNGEAVKYSGNLLYTIAVERVHWFRFGAALYSTYIFDNISLGPVAAMLTTEFADEKGKLQALDTGVDLETRWKTINVVKDSLQGKLKGRDAWYFGLGMAMREVTAPFQSDKKFDREEVQKALTGLAKFVSSAPADVPKELIDDLRAASLYKLDPAAKDETMFQEIHQLAAKINPGERRIQR
jgi:hypothetical protein